MNRFWNIPLIFLCPPLYFAFRGRWIAMTLNGIGYLIMLPLLFVGIGFIFWPFLMIHAFFDLSMLIREDGHKRQAELIAKETVKSTES